MNNVQSFRITGQPAGTYQINGGVGSSFGGSNGGVLGGLYALMTVSTGAGTIQLNGLGPDGATWVPIGSAISTTASYQTFYLPPGQYEVVVTGFTNTSLSLSKIPV